MAKPLSAAITSTSNSTLTPIHLPSWRRSRRATFAARIPRSSLTLESVLCCIAFYDMSLELRLCNCSTLSFMFETCETLSDGVTLEYEI